MWTRIKFCIECVCQKSVLPMGQAGQARRENDVHLENAALSTLLEKKKKEAGIPAIQMLPDGLKLNVHGLQFDTIVQ